MNKKNWYTFIDITLCWNLTLCFILFTIIGTLSHEAGHLLIAKLMGFKGGRITYGSTYTGHTSATDSLDYYYKKFRHELKNKVIFPEKTDMNHLEKKMIHIRCYFQWGGPLQTMLTGTLGLLILFLINRKKRDLQLDLSNSDWLWVFIALFWLRQVANCFMMFMLLIFKGVYGRGDETRLSKYYDLPPWTLNVVTGAVGAFVLHYVIFKFIPPHQRFTFVVAGLVGGVSGYILWLHMLGPIVLP
ncbi:hypothetical protein EXU85_33440 [Spirosoma sp. KCTC 42546]|uniref:hypothetical protein n=1 Tax=Spirosoma sp. KCTC 42546 TaxID=2520506 RepID=UPI00115B35BA|nr:hypothetical protein [Spirosoma sp. KCTC 42546]QDK83245.1 hypothetical protein EXU85_33440 [Spirosoma sp. KCTC 42546]